LLDHITDYKITVGDDDVIWLTSGYGGPAVSDADLKAADGVTVNGRKVETSVGQTTKTFFFFQL
jgi:hypothetical protein